MGTHQHLFDTILAYLHHNPQFGIWFAFLIAFAESLPIIGTIVPGSITMTIVGVLMGSGGLPILPTLFVASGAAFLGDCIGYFLGFHYNERLRTMWPFKNYVKWINLGEKFFKKHGGKSIILGRFFGPARSTVPLIAGLLKLTWLRFIVAAIPSALMWAILYLVPGVLLGTLSREIPKGETTRFLIYGICIIVALFAVFWLIQRFFTNIIRLVDSITDKTWQYLMKHHGGKTIIRMITNKTNPEDHKPLKLLFCACITGCLFLILFFSVRTQGVLTYLNYPTFHALQSIRTPALDHFFVAITLIGSSHSVPIVGLLVAGFLYVFKQKRASIHLACATIFTAATIEVFKHLSHSARPTGFYKIINSSSFPSGHTGMSTAVFFFIAYLFSAQFSKGLRAIPYTLATALTLLVSFSRLYLGAHWLTDIIGALLCATTIILLCAISYHRKPSTMDHKHLSHFKSISIILASFILPALYFFPHEFKNTLQDTKPIHTQKTLSFQNWWQHPFTKAPIYRNNRFGTPFQPFNVQYLGTLSQLEKNLTTKGWEKINTHHKQLKNQLARFASTQAQYHLSVFPWLYHNHKPALIMIKHIPMHQRIIELYIWRTDLLIDGHKPLWLGVIDIRIPPKVLLSLKEHTRITLENQGGLPVFAADTAQCEQKIVAVTLEPPKKIKMLSWNGEVLLLHCPP